MQTITYIVLIALFVVIAIFSAATIADADDWETVIDFIAPTAAQARDNSYTDIVEGL